MFFQFKSGIFAARHSIYHGESPSTKFFLQFVRWKRKPIWSPVAKSKLFRIPVKNKLPEDEELEIRRLYNIYRTEIKSIRSYLRNEYEDSMKNLPEQNTILEDADLSHALKVNEMWNQEVKAVRELRLAKEREVERSEILENMILIDQEAQANIKLIDSMVKQEKVKSSSFITPEKLDEAIEYALAHPVDYNYSIDLEGNTIYGLKAKPEVAHKAVDQQISTT